MKKQRESTLVLALFVAFVFSMAVILPGTAMAGPPAFVEKTGQTVSYAEGDDGDLQAGVGETTRPTITTLSTIPQCNVWPVRGGRTFDTIDTIE
jgi:hypothetical protein